MAEPPAFNQTADALRVREHMAARGVGSKLETAMEVRERVARQEREYRDHAVDAVAYGMSAMATPNVQRAQDRANEGLRNMIDNQVVASMKQPMIPSPEAVMDRSPPQPKSEVIVVPFGEEMTDEEVHVAIGVYMTNFLSYGLMPGVEQHTNHGQWKVTLQDRSGSRFRMEIVADALIDALRQADMAAGGWFAQREIERSVLEKIAPGAVGVDTMSGATAGIASAGGGVSPAPAGVVPSLSQLLDILAVPHLRGYCEPVKF
jgi:hypothetical protein